MDRPYQRITVFRRDQETAWLIMERCADGQWLARLRRHGLFGDDTEDRQIGLCKLSAVIRRMRAWSTALRAKGFVARHSVQTKE